MSSPSHEIVDAIAERTLAQAGGDPLTALALLDVREAKRRQNYFIKYYMLCGDQVEAHTMWQPSKQILLTLGGNGAGKSDYAAAVVTAWLLGKDYFRGEAAWEWVQHLPIPEPPTSVRLVGLNSDMLKDPLWEKLFAATDHPPFIPEGEIAERKDYSFYLRLKNGSKLQGKSADVDSKTHGGPTLDLVVLDEECSGAIYRENYQRIRKGGYLLVTATPLDDVGMSNDPWIYDLIEQSKEDPASEIAVTYMAMENNPHLDPEFKRKQIARWKGHPEEQARLYGRPVRRTGLYYKDWRAERPLWVPAHDIDQEAYRVVVIDPAANGPSGALWLAFDRRGKMSLYREYKEKGLTASQHVENILMENRGDPINLWLMDPFMGRQTVHSTGDEQQTVLQIWRKAGLPRLRLAEIDHEFCLQESREYIKAAFDPTDPHPGMEVFDHLDKFKDEIERCVIDSVQVGANRGISKDVPRKGNDDLLNCWQYACGMRLRARPGLTPQVAAPGSTNYFDPGGARPAPVKSGLKPWTDESW